MADEYLEGIMNRPVVADVDYVYSPQEQAARAHLIELIEAEKRAYLERIEPYIQRLSNIQGTPRMVIRTGLR